MAPIAVKNNRASSISARDCWSGSLRHRQNIEYNIKSITVPPWASKNKK
jgi:hypothetical protein